MILEGVYSLAEVRVLAGGQQPRRAPARRQVDDRRHAGADQRQVRARVVHQQPVHVEVGDRRQLQNLHNIKNLTNLATINWTVCVHFIFIDVCSQ